MTTIDQAIAAIDDEIERCLAVGDPHGYFAVVYRAVTARVRDGLAAGEFEDPQRMERFDVVFARHYLDACAAWRRGDRIPAAWRLAFDAAGRRDHLVLQHLLLGINAHINLDLGLAAAASAGPGAVAELRDDFERINDVLTELVDHMQRAIAAVSPWSRAVDVVGLRFDEALVCFSLRRARADAWAFASALSNEGDTGRRRLAAARDLEAAALARRIARPGVPLRWLVRAAVARERSDLSAVVEELARRTASN